MGREVRMVPKDWQHPRDERGRYRPMLDTSFSAALEQWRTVDLPEWIDGLRMWEIEGKVKISSEQILPVSDVIADAKARAETWNPVPSHPDYEWWAGGRPRRPSPVGYMPDWPAEQRTHFMMYEDTSEGTPISPAFATAEELARWLADNNASAFANQTASYDAWLSTINRGFAHSATLRNGEVVSGVTDLASTPSQG